MITGEKIFEEIWNGMNADEKNSICADYLRTLSKWDLKRVLCYVLSVDNYMDDEALRKELEQIIYTR